MKGVERIEKSRMYVNVRDGDDTIQYNTIQYNTIQYNTIQQNTIKYKYEYYYSGINPVEFRGHSFRGDENKDDKCDNVISDQINCIAQN